ASSVPRGPEETADVRISRIRIENLRGIERADLSLSVHPTFLVGENNAGKTSILQAVAIAFGDRQASRDDLRQTTDKAQSNAVVDVFLAPRTGLRFSEATRQRLQFVQRQPDGSRAEIVAFRTTFAPSNEGSRLSEVREFLQPVSGRWEVS